MLRKACAFFFVLSLVKAAHSLDEETSLLAVDGVWRSFRRDDHQPVELVKPVEPVKPVDLVEQCLSSSRKLDVHDGGQDASTVCSWDQQSIVTRLWNVIPYQTTDNVIYTFEKGFAPEVTQIPGFLTYLGAQTADPSFAFFTNIFSTVEGATEAQQGAQDFVAKGPLDDTITPNLFTEGQIKFQISNPELCDLKWPKLEGKVLSLRTWEPKPWSSAQEIIDIFEAGYAPVVSGYEGFQTYLGAKVVDQSDRELAFFLNVFDTQTQAEFANAQAVAFANAEGTFKHSPCDGLVSSRAEIIDRQTALVRFSFLEPNRRSYNKPQRYYQKPYRKQPYPEGSYGYRS